jgi:hypothetical protein|tara:strand:- start:58 stop:177 length:120 start_codon:yes stop_codon:yes gene_type:complete
MVDNKKRYKIKKHVALKIDKYYREVIKEEKEKDGKRNIQ